MTWWWCRSSIWVSLTICITMKSLWIQKIIKSVFTLFKFKYWIWIFWTFIHAQTAPPTWEVVNTEMLSCYRWPLVSMSSEPGKKYIGKWGCGNYKWWEDKHKLFSFLKWWVLFGSWVTTCRFSPGFMLSKAQHYCSLTSHNY